MVTQQLPTWKVVSISPRTEFVAGQGPVEGYRVNYETSTGVSGFVFTASSGLANKDQIAATIQTDVERLHAIHTLQG